MPVNASETTTEDVKRTSEGLRGQIAAELVEPSTGVGEETYQLLKFHGIYAQDDRDVRRERTIAGEGLRHIFMIRVVVPAGRLTAAQWLALDGVASQVADGSIRLTTRQAIQFHGVLKEGLRPLARALDEKLLHSFGGCGDVVRNVVACPEVTEREEFAYVSGLAPRLSRELRSTSSAYWEIFVDGEKAATRFDQPEHDFYGESYLPRKFKIAIAHPHENCVDVLAQDMGLVPVIDEVHGPGYAVFIGGGLGRAYALASTFARLGDALGFVSDDEVVEVARAVVDVFREAGDRSERRRARFKYVVADLGIDEVRRRVEQRLQRRLRLTTSPVALGAIDDHLGWREYAPGRYRLGVRVGAGRVVDRDAVQLRRALREVAETFAVSFVITPSQDLIIDEVDASWCAAIDEILQAAGVKRAEDLGLVERWAMACPALPTCGLALAESERRLPDVVGAIEGALAAAGVTRPVGVRMTGCPNGCARAAVSEIGIVGRTKSTYDLFVGGSRRGDRLARPFAEKVPLAEIASRVGPLFVRWRHEGASESFGDFASRVVDE